MARVAAAYPASAVVGACSLGAMGAGREVQDEPAVALVAAALPGARARAFRLGENEADLEAIAGAVVDPGSAPKGLVLLGDTWTCDADVLLPVLDEVFPGAVKVGGLVSAGSRRGATALFVGDKLYTDGLVGLALSGAITIETVVSQGCRPIGEPMLVTRSRGHIIDELGKRPPADVLRELFDASGERDRELLRTALFMAVERKKSVHYTPGETVVRNVVGLDPRSGSLALGAGVADWDVLQFVVRDADAAHRDWVTRLRAYAGASAARPAGALLFSCAARGKPLFGEASHDTRLLGEIVGPVPSAGLFCDGEIGPVGGASLLHGHTAVAAFFRGESGAPSQS